MPNNTTPDRYPGYTIADDGLEAVEMMDYYNQPYIGIKPVKKRMTGAELWKAFKAIPVGPGGGMHASAWVAREELKREIEEERI